MKILVAGGKSGWVEYVLEGTKTKRRHKDKIEIIDGDCNLTKKIYENDTTKQTYTKIILAFKGKVDDNTIKKVYEEFKENFLVGLEEDEYNIAAVVHKDTENYHIHVCLPKLNLRTKKHNNYYFDRVDRNRINILRDYLIEKYNLKNDEITLNENKELIKEDKTVERLDKWRKEHKQPKVSLKRKRGRDKATKEIKEYIEELI